MANYRGRSLPAGVEAPVDALRSGQQAKISRQRKLNRDQEARISEDERRAKAELDALENAKKQAEAAARRAQTASNIEVIGDLELVALDRDAWKTTLAEIIKIDRFDRSRSIAKEGMLAASAWVDLVGSIGVAQSIESAAQWEKILARVQAQINATVAKRSAAYFNATLQGFITQQAYQTAVQTLAKRYFTLYVNDSNAIPPLLRTPRRMREFSEILKERAVEILRNSLAKAIEEATEGLNDPAWPPEYTQLLMNRVAEIGEPGGVIKGFQITGEGIGNWRVSVDFYEIFGGTSDLEQGFHYGALVGDSPPNRETQYGTASRVMLPYHGQKLRNEEDINRYRYWKALATNQRYFYGRYENREKAVKGRRGALDYQHGKNLRAKKEIRKNLAEAIINRQTNDRVDKKGNVVLGTKSLAAKIDYLNAENVALRAHHRKADRETRAIQIPAGAWRDTVAARFAFWNKRGLAPIWLYLEFGQLVWQPVVPPRMLTYRFLKIARTAIDLEVENLMNAELAQAGLMRTSTGGLRAAGTPIMFGPNLGSVPKRGSFVKDLNQVVSAMNEHVSIAKRNRDEALAVAGRFAPLTTAADPQPFSINTPLTRFWDNLYAIQKDEMLSSRPGALALNGEDRELFDMAYKTQGGWVVRTRMAVRRNISKKSYTPKMNFGQRMAKLKKDNARLAEDRFEIHEAWRLGESLSGYRARKATEAKNLIEAQIRENRRNAREKAKRKEREKAARLRAKNKAKKKKP